MARANLPNPLTLPNIRWFIAFRTFFNARFYYPVFTILFLDFGLSLAQFAILNAVWAATIVLAEVPSGALADTLGRRRLVVFAGILMIAEMALLCWVPLSYPKVLFYAFLLNRVLSGLAEASASGADEALAYDSLSAMGLSHEWGRVLEWQIRFQSAGFIVAMVIGAAVYDPALMGYLAAWTGFDTPLDQRTTMRFPIYLTLFMAVLALYAALRLRENVGWRASGGGGIDGGDTSIVAACKTTLSAGRWILQTPFALMVILAGLLFDGVLRMVMTLISEYYRTILIPEALFGVIGSGLAILGLFIPRLGRAMADHWTPVANFFVLFVLTLMALTCLSLFLPIAGVLPVVFITAVMYFNRFFSSHYLNRIASTNQRATILSFRGLSFNLAYGIIGIAYSGLLIVLRQNMLATAAVNQLERAENAVFISSVRWFPVVFGMASVLLIGFARRRLARFREHRQIG